MLILLPALRLTAERINQEGRILGALPVVTNSILFNTTNADVVVSAMQVFPVTNPWNECISNRPVLVNSDAMIAQINSDVGSSRRKLSLFQEMNFVLVPDSQPLVTFNFGGGYPDQSDLNGGKSPGMACIRRRRTCRWRAGRSQTGSDRRCCNGQTIDDRRRPGMRSSRSRVPG